ncbi:iron ABC transporter permease [Mucilaginibacter sp. UR6-1]|uniref:FecCD family ABC transporter permease n=1 Tax=Mucilaginibacter sp. UR6-1 TaxID=1435643 RepID=UPI001E630924|nr:iron ABC transporter permease [Mucilaginibacter sp. UR6-1]MCC8407519.1 iron ABC transporter permease [Mucilaginibacter sp. UR6-1]
MNKKLFYTLVITGIVVSGILSIGLGAVSIPPVEVATLLFNKIFSVNAPQANLQHEAIITIVRLPRLLLGLLAGAALGISGASIQGIFRNPLAEPGLIGVSAGASLAAVAVIGLEGVVFAGLSNLIGYYLLAFGAFAGAGVTALIIYHISKHEGRPNITTMLLAGIAINALAGALTGLITYLATEQQLRNITFWMLGSLGGATWQTITTLVPFVLIPVILLPLSGKALNAFSLGEAQAGYLGIDVDKVKKRVILLSTMAVGSAVSLTGIISFVGLLVPHIVRLIIGVDNAHVLPASALLGALMLTLADLIARTIIAPIELPIGVITALIGAPVFLYILIRDKRKLII